MSAERRARRTRQPRSSARARAVTIRAPQRARSQRRFSRIASTSRRAPRAPRRASTLAAHRRLGVLRDLVAMRSHSGIFGVARTCSSCVPERRRRAARPPVRRSCQARAARRQVAGQRDEGELLRRLGEELDQLPGRRPRRGVPRTSARLAPPASDGPGSAAVGAGIGAVAQRVGERRRQPARELAQVPRTGDVERERRRARSPGRGWPPSPRRRAARGRAGTDRR